MSVYEIIGYIVVILAGAAAGLFVLVCLYANLIHRRFEVIFFRKTQRRLSLAGWHHTALSKTPPDEWPASDWPINERPFYASYRAFGRRFFIMAGSLGDHRFNSIKGEHP